MSAKEMSTDEQELVDQILQRLERIESNLENLVGMIKRSSWYQAKFAGEKLDAIMAERDRPRREAMAASSVEAGVNAGVNAAKFIKRCLSFQ